MSSKRSSSSSSRRSARPQANFLYDEPSGGFKKRRLGRACDLCRQKRSDSVTMPGNVCSNCISFNVECTHRGTVTQNEYSPISMQSLVEEILSSSTPYSIPKDGEVTQKLVMDLATYSRSLERRIYGLVQHLSRIHTQAIDSDAMPSNDGEADGVDFLADFLGNVSVSKPEKRFFGKSSMMSLWKLTLDMKDNHRHGGAIQENRGNDDSDAEVIMTPEFLTLYPSYAFPEHNLLLSLVVIYFDRVAVTFPFLHRPTFERSLADGVHLRDRGFGTLVLSVCACAAAARTNPQLQNDDTEKDAQAGCEWHSQLKPRQFDCLQPISLHELQMNINCILFVPFWSPNWMILCNTIRLAQEKGIHRKQWYDRQDISAVDKELWKRAFWALVFMDVFLTDYFGRTGNLAPEDYDLDLPVDCDDEYWPKEQLDPDKSFKQPQDRPSLMAHWLTGVNLAVIYRYGQRTLYAARRPQFIMGEESVWKQKVASQLDSAMNKWAEKIPRHLRWDPLLGFGEQNNSETPERRPKAQGTTFVSQESQTHLAVCVTAARSCIHLLDMYSQKYNVPPYGHVFVQILRMSLILVLNISFGKLKGLSDYRKTDLEYLLKCADILHRFQGSEIIQGFIDKCSASDTNVQPRIDRNRSEVDAQPTSNNLFSGSVTGVGPFEGVLEPPSSSHDSYTSSARFEGTTHYIPSSSVGDNAWSTTPWGLESHTGARATSSGVHSIPTHLFPGQHNLTRADMQVPDMTSGTAESYQGLAIPSSIPQNHQPDAVDVTLNWVHLAFASGFGGSETDTNTEQAQSIDSIFTHQPFGSDQSVSTLSAGLYV
ncbi:hypothetical protein K435DRAFT_798087 [Dendrothele bispora CBS 962.96]|uniref:Xylanolytic transcriptional activator regulatory domain-containing protein n=1 Tax=Dendrothele bispora (strain CBS 962.96) TaxID=1314807 RepID=A0A4S8M0W2_DENBC|nr:hypothetical protein K435DRAFT_798087 [Dendrothele bispora CBS 962.96]